MAARLKVFCASNGLTRSLVAVSSRAKALEAWGARADLFKQGVASEVTDPALIEAALARPGEVVTQAALDPGALEAALAAEPKPKGRPALDKQAKPAGPPRALLERVERLTARLAELDRRRVEAEDDLQRRRAELDEEERSLVAEHKRKRVSAERELSEAQAAVAQAGG